MKDVKRVVGATWVHQRTGQSREIHRVENARVQFGSMSCDVYWSQPGRKARRRPTWITTWNNWGRLATRKKS